MKGKIIQTVGNLLVIMCLISFWFLGDSILAILLRPVLLIGLILIVVGLVIKRKEGRK